MKQMFSYKKFNDSALDTLVESGVALAYAVIEGKDNTHEYEAANEQFNESFMKYCVEARPGAVFNSIEDVKNPMLHKNAMFQDAFNTVISAVISPVAPKIASLGLEQLAEVTQVGFGDNAKYEVDSNELFIVNSLAEGINRGAVQTDSRNEYTVTARREQVALYVDWYHVAS